MDKQLALSNSAWLARYGDRAVIRELSERLRRFLPNGRDMTAADALAFAQTAVALDLDPFAHEVWFVPKIGIVTGIAGYRKLARRQDHYVAQFRDIRPDEREKHNLDDGDIAAVCELYRPDQLRDAVEVNRVAGEVIIPIGPTIGVGIWRPKELETRSGRQKPEPTGRSWRWIAEKRAEADAIRKAFNLTIAFADDGAVIEGEVVDETPDELPGWAEEALEETEAPDPDELAEKRALLRGDDDADWDAQNFAEKRAKSSSDMAIEADFPPKAIEHAPDVDPADQTPQGLALPVEWWSYASLACERLGYPDYETVSGTLRKYAGVEQIANHRGIIQFDPVDCWTVLLDHTPAHQAKML